MTRAEAIAILSARLAGAPNLSDYVAWLNRQSNDTLGDLINGRPVHARLRSHAVA